MKAIHKMTTPSSSRSSRPASPGTRPRCHATRRTILDTLKPNASSGSITSRVRMLSPTFPATCKHKWTMSCSTLERRLDTKTFLRHSTSASKSTICQTTLSQILKKCHRWFNRSKNNNCVIKTLTNNQREKKKALLNHTKQSQQENAHLTKNLFKTNGCCDDVFRPDKR